MTLTSSLRARTRRAALVTLTTASVLVSGAVAAGAAPSPGTPSGTEHSTRQGAIGTLTAVPAAGARTATVTIPTTCAGLMHRTVDGRVDRYVYRGSRFTRTTLGELVFDNGTETPQAFALVAQTAEYDVFFAVRANGSLWRVVWDGSGLYSEQVSARGWGGVRHLTASPTGTMLYALTTSGGLYRYSVTPALTVKSLGAIATSGWSGVRFLSALPADDTYDAFVGVFSTTGGVSQYLVERSSGRTTSSKWFTSGWSTIRHLSVGSCANSPGASLIGINTSNNAFGYYDSNIFDGSAANLRSAGQVGSGFSGLLTD